MFRQILKTWTFCSLVLVIIPNFSFSNPVKSTGNEPKTMYEAIVHKCPQLEKTDLKENLKDIFNTSCADWTAINATNALLNQGQTNAQCIMLYESLLSFCTNLGDYLPKFKGLIPPVDSLESYTISTICLSNNSFSSLTKTEHNISSILQPPNCVVTCFDFGKVYDACKFSYYFASFDTSKFKTNSDLLRKNEDDSSAKEVPVETARDTNPSVEPENTKGNGANVEALQEQNIKQSDSELDKTAKKPVLKPQQTVNDDPSLSEGHAVVISPKQAPSPNSRNNNDPKIVEPASLPENAPQTPETQNDPTKVQTSNSVKDDGKNLENINPIAGAQDTVPANVENKEANKAPEVEKNQVAEPEIPQDAGIENSVEGNEEKGQANVADETDQEGFGEEDEEVEPEKANAKAEPVMPEEPAPKAPTKKVKPSTVEDEAVSNYNTPEDDMDGDSYFFSYFTVIMCLFIVGYVGYHNRQKILALLLEGKKGKRCGRQGRRPNSANYHKLDSNLEEAISSSCTKNASNVIY